VPSHYGSQELSGISPNRLEDVVIMSNIIDLRRKISVIKSKYPKLRNTAVWERHDRMVAELKKLESGGV
jgi:hypothetical protein